MEVRHLVTYEDWEGFEQIYAECAEGESPLEVWRIIQDCVDENGKDKTHLYSEADLKKFKKLADGVEDTPEEEDSSVQHEVLHLYPAHVLNLLAGSGIQHSFSCGGKNVHLDILFPDSVDLGRLRESIVNRYRDY
jgi:hypothetical protein